MKNIRFKTTIASILQATVVWLLAKWYITNDDAIYISSVLVAIWLSVNLYTNYGNKK